MEKEKLLEQTMFKTQYGSRLYGTNGPKSDVDWKYLFLPTIENMLLGKQVLKTKFVSPNVADKSQQVDEDFVPIQKFAHDFLKGVPYAVEIAFSVEGKHAQQEYVSNNVWFLTFIVKLRENFLNKKLSGFLGFFNAKRAEFMNKPITDYKDVYHTLRIAHETLELLETKRLTLPFESQIREKLLLVKDGKVSDTEIELMMDAYDARLTKALYFTSLPELTEELEAQFEVFLVGWLRMFYDIYE